MSLIVQSDSSSPIVLIVTDWPEFALVAWIEEFLKDQSLQVRVVLPQQYLAAVDQISTSQEQHYKTLVLIGFSPPLSILLDRFDRALAEFGPEFDQSLNQKQAGWSALIDQIGPTEVPTSFIFGSLSLQLAAVQQPLLKFLAAGEAQVQNLLKEVQVKLPGAQIFLAEDCLTQPMEDLRFRGEMELPLLFSILGLHSRVLLDPQQVWGLQTLEGFFTTIAPQLLKPHKAVRVLVRGGEVLSRQWLEQVQAQIQTYFAYTPPLLPVTTEPKPVGFTPDIICQLQSDVSQSLEFQVRSLPHALIKLEELTQRAAGFQVSLKWEPHYLANSGDKYGANSTSVPSNFNSSKPPASIKIIAPRQLKKSLSPVTPNPLKSAENSANDQLDIKETSPQTPTTEVVQSNQFGEKTPINQPILVTEPLSLELELQHLFAETRGSQKHTRQQLKARLTKKIISKSRRHKALFYLGFGLLAAGVVGAGLWGVFSTSYFWTLKTWESDLQALQTNQTQTVIPKPNQFKPLEWQLKIYEPILKDEFLNEAKTLIALIRDTRSFLQQSGELQQNSGRLIGGVLAGQSEDLAEQILKITTQLQLQTTTIADFLAESKQLDQKSLSQSARQQLAEQTQRLTQEAKKIAATTKVLKILPKVLGVESKQNLIVIVQDQRELRPTGGFIQAVGQLHFSRGLLTESIFQSAYELDKVRASKIQPPDEIKRFLGENLWFLRDSNWSVDLPTSAKQIRFFVQESTNQPVDGVAALTFEGVRRLIQASGPLDLPELNEQVTERNFYDRLEFHAETQSLTISNQSVDYLSLILTKLVTKISQLNPQDQAKIIEALYDLAESQDLQLTATDVEVRRAWTELGWGGEVLQPPCPSELATTNCVIDRLYQVDANVGINKVNPFIEKKVTDHIEVGETKISHQRNITYRNQAKLDSWPQGEYRAYLKFLLDKTAEFQSLLINGQPAATDQLLQYQEQENQVIGVVIQVPRQKSVTVELKYQLSHQYQAPFAYFFFNQKQAGTAEVQDILLSYQPTLKPRLITPDADLSSQLLNFHFQRETQSFVGAAFEASAK